MNQPTLFHLHFNTPAVDATTRRLEGFGVPLVRRFGSVRGEPIALGPDERAPEEFRLKLRVHRRDAVNVTIGPGQQPRFDHLGIISDAKAELCRRADAHGWPVQSNERRTFVMTPWEFRIELQHPNDQGVTALDPDGDYHLTQVDLQCADAETVREELATVFGPIPGLRIESGDRAWVESFTIGSSCDQSTIVTETLLRDDTGSDADCTNQE